MKNQSKLLISFFGILVSSLILSIALEPKPSLACNSGLSRLDPTCPGRPLNRTPKPKGPRPQPYVNTSIGALKFTNNSNCYFYFRLSGMKYWTKVKSGETARIRIYRDGETYPNSGYINLNKPYKIQFQTARSEVYTTRNAYAFELGKATKFEGSCNVATRKDYPSISYNGTEYYDGY